MDSVGYYLLYYAMCVITTVCLLYYSRILTKQHIINTRFYILMFIILASINFLSEVMNALIIKIFITIISFVIFIKYTSNLSFKRAFISIMYLFAIIMVSELLIGFIFSYIIDLSPNNAYLLLIIKMAGIFTTGILCFIADFMKKIFTNRRKNIDFSWVLVICIFLLLMTIAALNFVSTYNKMSQIYFLFLILLIFMILGVYYIFILLRNNYNKMTEINNLRSKNSEVVKYINEFKTYKHNLKYNLMAIKESGNNEVNKYIDELLNNNKNELEYINNFKEVPSNLIHVFSDCLTLNNDNNIEIIIKNAFKDKELNIDMNNYLQLNEIIGNCLTNAIEAVPDNGGFIYVYFYEEDYNQCIKIVNNFTNNINIDQIGELNYSTKNRDSGFGLNSILNNKTNIKVKGSIINNLFEITIKLPK